mmetsp:Transcript_18865/g.42037  ORF Transcript_18865/g.42037 Transcript_18865/m.42037 type:complete len:231 (+) Transcript_18865:70-762(+)
MWKLLQHAESRRRRQLGWLQSGLSWRRGWRRSAQRWRPGLQHGLRSKRRYCVRSKRLAGSRPRRKQRSEGSGRPWSEQRGVRKRSRSGSNARHAARRRWRKSVRRSASRRSGSRRLSGSERSSSGRSERRLRLSDAKLLRRRDGRCRSLSVVDKKNSASASAVRQPPSTSSDGKRSRSEQQPKPTQHAWMQPSVRPRRARSPKRPMPEPPGKLQWLVSWTPTPAVRRMSR